MSSREELESAHKKSLKNLEGEKRAAVKKAKGTKGKKAKQAIAAVEAEFADKLKELEAKHQANLAALAGDGVVEAAPVETTIEAPKEKELSEKERKQEKARRKKERQKEKARKEQEELEREQANAGPSLRKIELEQIQAVLTPLNMKVSEVEADGHCLYRAVAAQTNQEYRQIRALCADTLLANQDEFAPFCEYTDEVTSFDAYVNLVRSSAEWGGHLELRALGQALDRPIHVYSVQSGSKPLAIHDERNDGEKTPIRLSYHLHYYALGEHYNQVIDS